jgi:hypothetical protein
MASSVPMYRSVRWSIYSSDVHQNNVQFRIVTRTNLICIKGYCRPGASSLPGKMLCVPQCAIKAPHESLATETRVELLLHPEFKRTSQSVSDGPSSHRDC